MWVVCLQIHPHTGDTVSEYICIQIMNWKSLNPFNMQSEFTALQGAIHNLTNLKQEFEQIRKS